jgi:hypothetical protein
LELAADIIALYRFNVTNPNLIHEEIKNRLNSGSACFHSVQNLLSSRLLSKNVRTKILKPIIFAVVLHGRETWSLTLREERRLGVFEKRVLRRIFLPIRDEIISGWRKLHNEELHNSFSSPNIMIMMKTKKIIRIGRVGLKKENWKAYMFMVKKQKERNH